MRPRFLLQVRSKQALLRCKGGNDNEPTSWLAVADLVCARVAKNASFLCLQWCCLPIPTYMLSIREAAPNAHQRTSPRTGVVTVSCASAATNSWPQSVDRSQWCGQGCYLAWRGEHKQSQTD